VDYIIWMDSEKAQVFGLNTAGIEKSNLKKGGMDHLSTVDSVNDEQLNHFYKDLSHKLSDANDLLIMGPGLSKTHFKTYLDSHHAHLAKNVVGVENSDHPTDNQILEAGKAFFKKYEFFNTPVTTAH
jgi:stalled ribosome rescue protein Dom34